MDLERLAELLFPNVTQTPADMEALYPPRVLPEGAKVSVKNQELRYNYDAANPVQRIEHIETDDDSWFYII